MITTKLRILLIEDYKTDAELIQMQIKQFVEDYEIKVVDNLEDFSRELQTFVPDVILSDYNLPTCTGLDILQEAKVSDPNIPFIFITGTIDDDEMAANTILSGASGFILKKHMNNLAEKLEPLFKQVVFNMIKQDELREKIRKNKIAVNQIYDYLDKIDVDTEEQKLNINKIRKNIDLIKLQEGEKEE
ncbi:response regulator [Mesonia sp.]|uniref:response regulator n=1 Tax=Mesonia sp. TaxID=1960830 RepID=UPI001750E6B4|nr:response regulator [Mesonia sp.]HIB37945.1 response regulator [Mesonia sp.]HIO27376.1 response regulator [Flavobacteriaceae bacterium]